MKKRRKFLGQEHNETLQSMILVGSIYRLIGKCDEAEKLEVQVTETSLRALGAEHLDTLTSKANLVSTYRD